MKNEPKNEFSRWAAEIAGPLVINTDGLPFDELKPYLLSIYKGINRFIDAQNRHDTYQKALDEIRNGKKVSHWIWYIFPQMKGLGKSEISQFYGINGREEAYEYIANNTLRNRLVEATEAVLNNEHSVYDIFGEDTIKFRACMLLFASVSDIPVFKQVIKKYHW